MKTGKQKLAIMKAFYEKGALVISRRAGRPDWEICEHPSWEWGEMDYALARPFPVARPKPSYRMLFIQSCYRCPHHVAIHKGHRCQVTGSDLQDRHAVEAIGTPGDCPLMEVKAGVIKRIKDGLSDLIEFYKKVPEL